jgi:hypothetical protein
MVEDTENHDRDAKVKEYFDLYEQYQALQVDLGSLIKRVHE